MITEQARDASRVDLIEQLGQDTRYALRGFRHAPRFALTVVLTIGLGLGLVSTAFTIFDAYVLRPLEVRDPRSLYELELRDLPVIPAFDAVALVGGTMIVLMAALGAAYVPSRRAAAVDPVESLRS